jgi:riboflavin synthase
MFTGLIEACAPVLEFARRGDGAALTIPLPAPEWISGLGESVAVSGCCLTVADWSDRAGERRVRFELSAETLGRTWFGDARPGALVNLERALRLSDRLGGHLVSGHVDGVGTIVAIRGEEGGGKRFTFESPSGFERYLVDKGSVALDGISLTVVEPRGRTFDVAVIDTTLRATHLGSARVGQPVHFEADLVAKWIERFVRT